MTLKNEEKDKRSRLYLFIIIIALFLVNGILIYNLISSDRELTKTKEEKVDLTDQVDHLNTELDKIQLELDDYMGKNQQLDSIIDIRNSELADKVAELRAAVNSKNISEARIRQLQKEIEGLKSIRDQYIAQVDSLSRENQFLKDDIYAKEQEIKRHQDTEDALAQDLMSANEKVRIGSILKVQFMEAYAVKVKGTDKEKEVTKLSKADKIKIHFIIGKNDVAEPGQRTAYLKIITPSKATLHNEERGSGKFKYKGEESLYTAKQAFQFRNSNEEITFYWDKSPAMITGDYEAYIFCEDEIIGQAKFSLK
ncbi:MAG: hypothetical protein GC181_07295 [Bacteroidetes bacterium]|nr:hypothetical protein [Bacteroidota bacterium]